MIKTSRPKLCRHFRFLILMHAFINACAKFVIKKSKMAGDGDREMVLANFQVNVRFSCILCLFLCQPVLLLILIQSITGIENLDECITLLDHHNWDLMVGSAKFLPCELVYLLFIAFTLIDMSSVFKFRFLGLCEFSPCRPDGFSLTVKVSIQH